MKPTFSPRSSTFGLAFAFQMAASVIWGCARPATAPDGFAPLRVEVPEQPPVETPAEEVRSTETVSLRVDAGVEALPASWGSSYYKPRSFAEEIAAAKIARTSFEAAVDTIGADGGVPAAKQFERVNALLDQASRRYATAYHASDATTSAQIEVLHDAAKMILAWSRRLDEAGLAKAPAVYKTDPLIALTYEDIADGPAKHWREDGLSLVHLCVESARSAQVDSAAARDCAAMRTNYGRVIAKRPLPNAAHDAGMTACACDPGDPLCSSSMNGWCRPSK